MMRFFGFAAMACVALVGCNSQPDSEPVAETEATGTPETTASLEPAEPPKQTIQPTISLGQALRCKRIAEFAVARPEALGGLTVAQARTIALKSQNAAYSEGAKQDLTPEQIDKQERDIYLGYEGAGMPTFRFRRGDKTAEEEAQERAEDARNAERRQAAVDRVMPELKAELAEICAPFFL